MSKQDGEGGDGQDRQVEVRNPGLVLRSDYIGIMSTIFHLFSHSTIPNT